MRPRIAAVVVMLLAPALVARAQPLHDHLECYKMKDPLALKGVVDVDASPVASALGCKLGRGRYFCAPASKTVLASNVVPSPVAGRELSDDRICYKLRCPKPNPGDQSVRDQFGERVRLEARAASALHARGEGAAAPHHGRPRRHRLLQDPRSARAERPRLARLAAVRHHAGWLRREEGPPVLRSGHDRHPGDQRRPVARDRRHDPRRRARLLSARLSHHAAARTADRQRPLRELHGDEARREAHLHARDPRHARHDEHDEHRSTSTITTTTLPPGTDQALVCQRAIETGGHRLRQRDDRRDPGLHRTVQQREPLERASRAPRCTQRLQNVRDAVGLRSPARHARLSICAPSSATPSSAAPYRRAARRVDVRRRAGRRSTASRAASRRA